MNRRLFRIFAVCAVVAFVVGLSVSQVRAQAKKAEAPKTALHSYEETLANWNEIGRKLIGMAEDMPEAKYWFQPTKDVRPFGEMLLHAGGASYDIINAAAGRQVGKSENDPARKDHNSKAAVVAYLKKVFADGAAVLKATKSDADFDKPVNDPWGNRPIHPVNMWGKVIGHASEHYGSLVTYYRVQGMVPPESRPRK